MMEIDEKKLRENLDEVIRFFAKMCDQLGLNRTTQKPHRKLETESHELVSNIRGNALSGHWYLEIGEDVKTKEMYLLIASRDKSIPHMEITINPVTIEKIYDLACGIMLAYKSFEILSKVE